MQICLRVESVQESNQTLLSLKSISTKIIIKIRFFVLLWPHWITITIHVQYLRRERTVLVFRSSEYFFIGSDLITLFFCECSCVGFPFDKCEANSYVFNVFLNFLYLFL